MPPSAQTVRGRSSLTGFTLIEIITVLLVISIVSAVIVNRLMDTSVELIAQTDVIKTHLRYAQSRAMSSNAYGGFTVMGIHIGFLINGNITNKVFYRVKIRISKYRIDLLFR